MEVRAICGFVENHHILSEIADLQYQKPLNATSPRTLDQGFGSLLFIWELLLDVVLSLVLVGFLNYQVF